MNVDVAVSRARVTEQTENLENRLVTLRRRLGDLIEELTETHAAAKAALIKLDDLCAAQTAANHAVDAIS
ncbi:hypothetical protein [uncultured Modestobacter sp.]|uniref:hypothetical protein n=1 Tax=uncultured Modestobacter sp. TaxID=380048 RepID=UPI00261A5691|nr:hypothetical protein [uncultured Modestobacter sp.]